VHPPNRLPSFAASARAVLTALLLCAASAASAAIADDDAWRTLHGGAIVLLRHATAPGVGDPQGFMLGDCRTQRNLDAKGRAEATRIGDAFRARGITVDAVLSSQWCRTHETAELAFPGRTKDEPAFNSFFDDAANDATQTAAARALLLGWRGPGVLVVVSHQVNITALTGLFPGSGEGIVVARDGGALKVVGRIDPSR